MTYVFKILTISIFDGDQRHTKLIFNFLKYSRSQVFEPYCVQNLGAISKESVRFVIQINSVEERSDTARTKICSRTFRHVHIIFCVPKLGRTPLALNSEKSATIHKHYNRKYFLDLILKIACGCNGGYLKIIGILKYLAFLQLIYI